METLLKTILKSPRLYEYSKIIQQTVESEQEKRNRFYQQFTEQQKAEFVNGEIVIHSPVKREHSIASDNLFSLIKYYVISKKLGEVSHEKALVKLTRNDFEPDICFFKNEKSIQFTQNQMFFPAPDFIAEVLSKGTEKTDRGIKFKDYAFHGVGEYWLINTDKKEVEQYVLYNKRFEIVQIISHGDIRSYQIEDFEIPVKAIFEEQENFKTLISFTKDCH